MTRAEFRSWAALGAGVALLLSVIAAAIVGGAG
jgi:hypothetical protein